MFLHLSVSHSVHRGVCILACIGADTATPVYPSIQHAFGKTPPVYPSMHWGRHPPGHCSGRYASYWNAFLYSSVFTFSLQDAVGAFEKLLTDNKNGSVMFFNKVDGAVKARYVQQEWNDS